MEGFSLGVLIGAFIGNSIVQIWGTRKDSVLSVDDPVEHTTGPVSGIFQQSEESAVDADGTAIRIIPVWKWLLDF